MSDRGTGSGIQLYILFGLSSKCHIEMVTLTGIIPELCDDDNRDLLQGLIYKNNN